ncbi:UEV domain-containing protein [Apiospora saccharicola]
MAVQQHVLNWLYSVLTSEYHNVNRTYNDVAQALSVYPSLSPRTDVHTFDNGVSALLVHLTGTIPVVFRGTTYRFPISIWVPHAYPREAPLAYVTPTESMMVRPGQHVDPQGRIYHPYLVGWLEFWDKSSILDFLAILRDVFAKEPPVIARQQQPIPPQPEQSTATPPPVPPLPAELSRTPLHTQSPAVGDRPPPPPPKGSDAPQVVPGQAINAADGPPLPPLPHEASSSIPSSQPPTSNPLLNPATKGHRNLAKPPHPQQQMHQPPIQPQMKPPPPPDIMDEPLTLSLPSPSNIPPPPIPPNPEKDALLRQLASTLYSHRMRARQQNESSLAGLTAQRNAMLAAAQNLQCDASNLAPLSAMLSSNTSILQSSLQEADHAPGIDELLVAPTVVGNQLYDVIAEERTLGDTIFMLGRAVERGRVAPAVFAKTVRSLAREQYLKKALARKIGKGMGLVA